MTTTVQTRGLSGQPYIELRAYVCGDEVALGSDHGGEYYLRPDEAEEIGRSLVALAAMARKKKRS